MASCRAFGLKGPYRKHPLSRRRACYTVFCFDCRYEEEIYTKAAAEAAGKDHIRERRAIR